MAISALKTQYKPQILDIHYTATYSITANGNQTVSLSSLKDENNQSFAVPDGYQRLSVVRLTTGDANVIMRGYDIWSTTGGIYLSNLSSSAANNKTVSVYITFIRTS